MIPLCEDDYIIIETENFKGKFKPPIDKIETEIMQFNDEDLDNRPEITNDPEKFEAFRQKLRDFLSLILVELTRKRVNKTVQVYKDTDGIPFIPFALLPFFVIKYMNHYNMSIGELKN